MILTKLNELKNSLNGLRPELEKLSFDNQNEIMTAYQNLLDDLQNLASLIEKTSQDEEAEKAIKDDIISKMREQTIYDQIPLTLKNQIAKEIMISKDLSLITDQEFKKLMNEWLSAMPSDKLTQYAYSADQIERYGSMLVPKNASKESKYDAGFEALTGHLDTPTGRQEAINEAIIRNMKRPTSMQLLLKKFYGV